MGVDTETVDFRIPDPRSDIDDGEYLLSRNFTYLARNVGNVRNTNDVFKSAKKKPDWDFKAEFANLNSTVSRWLEELPAEMQIHYPSDGSLPWLPSHFLGNMHCYYHLSVIMLHRPQLMNSSSFAAGGSWKQHMATCYSSAKNICRIQEALHQTFDIVGLTCMQRGMVTILTIEAVDAKFNWKIGVNFTIYCILTCTMLHLVRYFDPPTTVFPSA